MGNIHIVSTLRNKQNQKKTIFKKSSTVFFAILNYEKKIDTEISLLNHFLLKRNLKDVVAKVEIRSLRGYKIKSLELNINKPKNYIFRLSDYFKINLTCSIYIFFESKHNLAVPFCAVVSAIKTSNSVCAIHTYGRRLENQELSSNIDLPKTIESGWTLRDTNLVKSFAVLHGGKFKLKLNIKIQCRNKYGKTIQCKFQQKINPFSTLLVIPQNYFKNLISHLDGENGDAKIFIDGLSGVFPRMMCGNFLIEDNEGIENSKEMQFTHSNFDFSEIEQPDSNGKIGFINNPKLPQSHSVIYPVKTRKKILVNKKKYKNNSRYQFKTKSMNSTIVKSDSCLPSRLVAGTIGKWKKNILESECSTGIFIEDYLKVPCHWHWGLLKPGFDKGRSFISIFLNNFGKNTVQRRKIKFQIYSEFGKLIEKNLYIKNNTKIDAMKYLPVKSQNYNLWYVFTGEKLEDLNIYSTFFPEKKSGFVEHSF
tara:strand:+ start:239 stop:1675 length:1437 start_codon:yes stop_codon:yes gene_type:complete